MPWNPTRSWRAWRGASGHTQTVQHLHLSVAVQRGDVEVSRLARYAAITLLVGGCALLSAWSRVDYRTTAADLGAAETRYRRAQGENDRLQLELQSLRHPRWLETASDALQLDATVQVVLMETSPSS